MARLINNTHLFLHTAKAGGTFFREVLNRYGIPNHELGDKHSKWDDFLEVEGIVETFGFVREPISWYRSRWAYAMLTQFGEQLSYNKAAQSHWMAKVWSNDINTFVGRTLETHPDGICTEYFDRMLNIFGLNTNIKIHRMEDMNAIVMHYLMSFGKFIKPEELDTIPRENASVADHKYPYGTFKNDFGRFKKEQIAKSLQHEIIFTEKKLYTKYYNDIYEQV